MSQDFAPDLLEMLHQVQITSEPRLMAILPASYIEKHITDLIRQRLPGLSPKLDSELFDLDKPLYPIATKLRWAVAMGAIKPDILTRARKVLSVRSLFAHRLDVKDFSHPEVAKIAGELLATPSIGRMRIYTPSGWVDLFPETIERQFVLAALCVCVSIFRGNANEKDFELNDLNVPGPWRSI